MTNEQIIDALKKMHGVESDNALAGKLGVSRQTIWQFKQGQETDIKIKIICDLLARIV